jgi:hypothetical protein
MSKKRQRKSVACTADLTIPKLEQCKTAVLNTLVSVHSKRSYKYAIERFIAWYCARPRLAFNRSVVVQYRSFLESLCLSSATINLHLSAIRRLADESARADGSALNWRLESGELRESSGLGGRSAIG